MVFCSPEGGSGRRVDTKVTCVRSVIHRRLSWIAIVFLLLCLMSGSIEAQTERSSSASSTSSLSASLLSSSSSSSLSLPSDPLSTGDPALTLSSQHPPATSTSSSTEPTHSSDDLVVRDSSSTSEGRETTSSSPTEAPTALPTTTTTPTTTAKPAERTPRRKRRLVLIALVVLIVPVVVLAYVAWRLVKRCQHRRIAEGVKLSGERHPGEVDDKELGRILSEGDWLHQRTAGATSAYPGVSSVGTALAPTEFDPIGKQAETQRQKRERRRQYLDGDEDGEGTRYEDGEEEDVTDDGSVQGGASAPRPVYAATMATDQPLFASEEQGQVPQSPQGFGSSPKAAAGTTTATGGAQLSRHYDPSEYSLANQALLERYAELGATGGRGGTGLLSSPDSVPSPAQPQPQQQEYLHRRQESNAFENILSSVAAPVTLGDPAYHQKPGTTGATAVPVRSTARPATTSAGMYSPAEGPDDVGSDSQEARGYRDASALSYDEDEEEEEEEEEEEDEPNLR